MSWFRDLRGRLFHGYRADQAHREGRTGAVPAGPPGERPRGAEQAGDSGAGVGPEPVAEEIIAWRSWDLRDGALWSTTQNFCWDGPSVTADAVPTADNSNGIYALQEISDTPITDVWGQVELSGLVVEGEKGYRAERATIRSLYIGRRQKQMALDGITPPQHFYEWPEQALVQALAARYAVDVKIAEPRIVPGVEIRGNLSLNAGASVSGTGSTGIQICAGASHVVISNCIINP